MMGCLQLQKWHLLSSSFLRPCHLQQPRTNLTIIRFHSPLCQLPNFPCQAQHDPKRNYYGQYCPIPPLSLPRVQYQSQTDYYNKSPRFFNLCRISYRYYYNEENEDEDDAEDCSFDQAVALFNSKDYYKCHDLLETLWINAQEPSRTLFHGILQCAVGLHHLFNQNHKGAMMELGEGLCKLRKMNFENGPFYQFEREISATLEFLYQTQIELAACTDDLCVAMDQSERSYQLLGGYAAGQHLYSLLNDHKNVTYIVFSPQRYSDSCQPPKVKLPILNATEEHLI